MEPSVECQAVEWRCGEGIWGWFVRGNISMVGVLGSLFCHRTGSAIDGGRRGPRCSVKRLGLRRRVTSEFVWPGTGEGDRLQRLLYGGGNAAYLAPPGGARGRWGCELDRGESDRRTATRRDDQTRVPRVSWDGSCQWSQALECTPVYGWVR